MKYKCIATAAFGLDGIVSKELEYLGFQSKAESGGARFEADLSEILIANIYLRCADRVYIILREQNATSFDMIFEQMKAISWEAFMKKDANIVVNAKCVRSQIMSPRDCQSIGKKAIVKRLQEEYNVSNLPENGALYNVDINIHNNLMRVTLDSSGEALHKRGYRTWNAAAPIRETLAAAILKIAPWKLRQPLYDPCCGSGTFLVEAAFQALKRPSGMTRTFDIEKWGILSKDEIIRIKEAARSNYHPERELSISGSDIDTDVLALAKKHIDQAGLSGKVSVENCNLKDLNLGLPDGCFVVNPPYGDRLSERREAQKLYTELGLLLKRHKGWSMAVISSDPLFEKYFGRKADKKRRVYNARLECNIYIYEAK